MWALDLAIRMMDLTTLEGKDTPGQGPRPVRQGDAPAAGRPDDPVRRRGLRLPGAWSPRPRRRCAGSERQGRQRRDRLPDRPDVPRHQARRDACGGRGRRRRDRHGHRPRRVPVGRLRDRVRRDRRGQGGLRRRRTSRSSSRPASWRRTTTSGARASWPWPPAPTSSRPRPARSRRPRRCRSRSSCSRRSATSSGATGRQVGMKPAGGIRTAKEAIQYLVVLYETLGPRWMTPGLVPVRGVVAAQRRADADRVPADRPLPGPGPLHARLRSRAASSRGLLNRGSPHDRVGIEPARPVRAVPMAPG